MVRMVHVTTETAARRIARSGVAARSRNADGARGVYCMPVLRSFMLTHQWVRELRRWRAGVLVAVDLRLPDDLMVTVGHYGGAKREVAAAGAAEAVREELGFEVFVPRAVSAAEVVRVRAVPQGVGWRYQPGAHGRRPCGCPACVAFGTRGSASLRRSYEERRETKPEIMAGLRAATDVDEIIGWLMALGSRSRGGAEELEYLVDHPDPEVRETLAETLAAYRGPVAKRLRAKLLLDGGA